LDYAPPPAAHNPAVIQTVILSRRRIRSAEGRSKDPLSMYIVNIATTLSAHALTS
jgi:hypothetical protein